MAAIFGENTPVILGFDLGAKKPVDTRFTVATIADRNAHVENNRAYEGMLVYVEADKVTYQYVADAEGNLSWKEFGFNEADFLAHVADDLTTNDASKALSAAQGVALKGLIDAEAEAAREAEEGLQTAIDELGAHVGELPEGTSATSVIDYVNIKTAGIATDAALEELNNQVFSLQTAVQGIAVDYLTSEDKTELSGLVTTEKERAMGVEEGLRTDVDTIVADYLKAADKTALEGKINLKADQSALDEVSSVANAAVKQSDYNTKVAALEDEDERIASLVAAEEQRATGVENGLKGRIETMEAFWAAAQADGTDSNVIDTLIEIQEYIAGDETGAAEMAASIKKNSDDISAMDTAYKAADVTLQNNIDKKADITTVNSIDTRVENLETASATHATKSELKVVSDALDEYKTTHEDDYTNAQIDAAIKVVSDNVAKLDDTYATDAELASAIQGEVTRANAAYADKSLEATVSNLSATVDKKAAQSDLAALGTRVTTAEGKISTLEGSMAQAQADIDAVEAAVSTKAEQNALSTEVAAREALDARVVELEKIDHEHSNKGVLDGITSDKVKAWDEAESNAKIYTDGEIDKVERIIGEIGTDKTVVGLIREAVTAAEAGDTQAAANAQTYTDEKIAVVNATIGTVASGKTVVGLINEAVATAASDVTSKANTAETNAKSHTDKEIGRVEGVISTLQGVVNGKAAQSEVNTISDKAATLESKVSTLEGEMDAVEAKVSANETAISNLQTAVNGKAAQGDLDGVVARVDAFELWQESFEPIKDTDIEALFKA